MYLTSVLTWKNESIKSEIKEMEIGVQGILLGAKFGKSRVLQSICTVGHA